MNFETEVSYFGADSFFENYEVIDVDDLYNKVIYSNHLRIYTPSLLIYTILFLC